METRNLFRLRFVGIAVGVLAAVLIWPGTRWPGRTQAACLVPGPGSAWAGMFGLNSGRAGAVTWRKHAAARPDTTIRSSLRTPFRPAERPVVRRGKSCESSACAPLPGSTIGLRQHPAICVYEGRRDSPRGGDAALPGGARSGRSNAFQQCGPRRAEGARGQAARAWEAGLAVAVFGHVQPGRWQPAEGPAPCQDEFEELGLPVASGKRQAMPTMAIGSAGAWRAGFSVMSSARSRLPVPSGCPAPSWAHRVPCRTAGKGLLCPSLPRIISLREVVRSSRAGTVAMAVSSRMPLLGVEDDKRRTANGQDADAAALLNDRVNPCRPPTTS